MNETYSGEGNYYYWWYTIYHAGMMSGIDVARNFTRPALRKEGDIGAGDANISCVLLVTQQRKPALI